MAFPRINNIAPAFSGIAVQNEDFIEINSAQYVGKYLVLFFYPMDFTFVCPTELTLLSDRIGEFKELNCELLGVSTDSQFSHYTWLQIPRKEGGLGKLDFPLLADKSAKIARAYGVFNEITGLAYRGFFIIDWKGLIRQITINDLAVGRSIDEILRLVKAFQFSDENGEACPANWQPGESTIKPDPVESKLYFNNSNKQDNQQNMEVPQQKSHTSNKSKTIDSTSKLTDIYSIGEDSTAADASLSMQHKSEVFSTGTPQSGGGKVDGITSNMSKIPPMVVDGKKAPLNKAGEVKSTVSTVQPVKEKTPKP